jgi:hypothetical protein
MAGTRGGVSRSSRTEPLAGQPSGFVRFVSWSDSPIASAPVAIASRSVRCRGIAGDDGDEGELDARAAKVEALPPGDRGDGVVEVGVARREREGGVKRPDPGQRFRLPRVLLGASARSEREREERDGEERSGADHFSASSARRAAKTGSRIQVTSPSANSTMRPPLWRGSESHISIAPPGRLAGGFSTPRKR